MSLVAVLSALLSLGAAAFGGGGMDPNGCPVTDSAACSAAGDKGWGMDPNGSPSHAAATDRGSMIDANGKPRR